MLTATLPILDVYFNIHGSINIDQVESELDTDTFTLEDLANDFIENCRDEDTDLIESPENIQAAFNLLDSLRTATRIVEDALFEHAFEFAEDNRGLEYV